MSRNPPWPHGSTRCHMKNGWHLSAIVDDDGHLNVYVTHDSGETIREIETGQGDGEFGEQLAFRMTTDGIELDYLLDAESEDPSRHDVDYDEED